MNMQNPKHMEQDSEGQWLIETIFSEAVLKPIKKELEGAATPTTKSEAIKSGMKGTETMMENIRMMTNEEELAMIAECKRNHPELYTKEKLEEARRFAEAECNVPGLRKQEGQVEHPSGRINVTFEELMKTKFDVVNHFGMCTNGRFFVMNTVPPVEYGADCRSYAWFEVNVKTESDLAALKDFIKAMFGLDMKASTIKQAIKEVNNLDKHFARTIKAIDYGACHVRFIPIADQFRKVGVVNG